MTTNITKRAAGASLLLLAELPFVAQAQPASAPASQPDNTVPNTTPTWMVADVGIALVIGLVAGYLIGAWRSAGKTRASHA